MRPLLPLALAVAVLPSCITTDLNLAPLPNVPPSIESTSTAENPLNRVIVYRPMATSDGGIEDFQPLELEYVIRDPDVEQTLQFQFYVDDRSGPGDAQGVLEDEDATDDPMLRTISFNTSMLTERLRGEGCHRIELLVSERFRFGSPEPEVEGDIGTAVWWVATCPGDPCVVDMTGCR